MEFVGSHGAGGFSNGKTLGVSEPKDFPMPWFESAGQAPKGVGVILGGQEAGGVFLHDASVGRQLVEAFSGAEMAGSSVARDGKEPGSERKRRVVALQTAPCPAKSLLSQVFGVLPMSGVKAEEIKNLGLKAQNDLLERVHAALCGEAGEILGAVFGWV